MMLAGGFGAGGLDPPIEKKGDPHHGKERFKEPEHAGPPALSPIQSYCTPQVLINAVSTGVAIRRSMFGFDAETGYLRRYNPPRKNRSPKNMGSIR